MDEEKFRRQILEAADKFEAKDKDLAQRIRAHVDDLVAWYKKNQRELTLKEFREIIGRG